MIKCVMVNTEFSTIEDVNQPSLTSIRSSTCIKKKKSKCLKMLWESSHGLSETSLSLSCRCIITNTFPVVFHLYGGLNLLSIKC